jgi:hypothetical protein
MEQKANLALAKPDREYVRRQQASTGNDARVAAVVTGGGDCRAASLLCCDADQEMLNDRYSGQELGRFHQPPLRS